MLGFGDQTYFRLVLTAYWEDSCPSTEVFFLAKNSHMHELSMIADLEQKVFSILKMKASSMPLRVIYITHSNVEMSYDECAAADWRVMTMTAKTPAPSSSEVLAEGNMPVPPMLSSGGLLFDDR